MRVKDEGKQKKKEMTMLCMLHSKTLKNKVCNKKIREMTGMESIEEFLREQKLR